MNVINAHFVGYGKSSQGYVLSFVAFVRTSRDQRIPLSLAKISKRIKFFLFIGPLNGI